MLTRRGFLAVSVAAVAVRGHIARAQSPAVRLFDAHCHLKSEDLQRYPRVASAPASGGPPPPTPDPAATPVVERVLQWMDASGVEAGAAVQHRGTYGFDNRYILDSSDAHADRLAPVVVLDAQDPGTPALLRSYRQAHGLAGVRLTGAQAQDGSFPWLDSTAAQATWAVANELGLVVDLMTVPPGESVPAIGDFVTLAERYPRAKLVLDHVAWPTAGVADYGIDEAHRSLAKRRNVFFKFTTINLDFLTGANVDPASMLRHVVDVYGADHVLWGSDIGNSAGLYPDMVSRMIAATAKLTAKERTQVLHDTGKSVFVRGGKAA